ncbi:hypothetical protein D1007_45100 [Hordeum vulgare]|nr:hypothetical protein D1007_45100 [Hordeum vulgare]
MFFAFEYGNKRDGEWTEAPRRRAATAQARREGHAAGEGLVAVASAVAFAGVGDPAEGVSLVGGQPSLALQAEPRFPRALLRNACTLEALGRHELPLADTLALLALDPHHHDAIDLSHRLRARIFSSPSSAEQIRRRQPQISPDLAGGGASSEVRCGASATTEGQG